MRAYRQRCHGWVGTRDGTSGRIDVCTHHRLGCVIERHRERVEREVEARELGLEVVLPVGAGCEHHAVAGGGTSGVVDEEELELVLLACHSALIRGRGPPAVS